MIRKAVIGDIDTVLSIYDGAREYMRRSGNAEQWGGGYPSADVVKDDIDGGNLYVLVENEEILAVFFFRVGVLTDINNRIVPSDKPYAVIHRIAISSKARGRGVSGLCFDFAFSKADSVKIDTHKDNLPMQRALAKYGFKYCGKIYLENGDERLAYQKEI